MLTKIISECRGFFLKANNLSYKVVCVRISPLHFFPISFTNILKNVHIYIFPSILQMKMRCVRSYILLYNPTFL